MKEKSIQMALAVSAVATLLFIASSGIAIASDGEEGPRSATDPRDVNPNDLADFDIMSFGFSGNTPYIHVYGLAGRTVETAHQDEGDHERILAYVINTNSGIWALDLHSFDHDPDEADQNQWHGQRVDVISSDCVRVESTESKAKMAGSRAFFEETSGVDTINSASTMMLEILNDPHEFPDAECHAKVIHVFDDAGGEPVSQASRSEA